MWLTQRIFDTNSDEFEKRDSDLCIHGTCRSLLSKHHQAWDHRMQRPDAARVIECHHNVTEMPAHFMFSDRILSRNQQYQQKSSRKSVAVPSNEDDFLKHLKTPETVKRVSPRSLHVSFHGRVRRLPYCLAGKKGKGKGDPSET